MAEVHPNASITPTKLEIARDWLVAQPWFDGDPDALKSGSRFSYRFDDPFGQVGVEVLLVKDGDRTLQVPLTYRGAERPTDEGGPDGFLTDMVHTVLGKRWIYDGMTDPVLVAALVNAVLTGAQQEDFEVEIDGERQVFPASVRVRGTGDVADPVDVAIYGTDRNGSTTVARTSAGDLVLPHVTGALDLDGRQGLVGTWPDGPETVFAVLGSGRSEFLPSR